MSAIVEPETQSTLVQNEARAAIAPRVDIARPLVLAASGLRKAFGGQVVLDGVDLELREGEVILLRGDNGSGKTTLINILTGNLEPDAGTIHYLANGSPGEFRFPRRWWQELNPFDQFTPESTAREGIGRMWQDVRLFRSQTLRENIAVAGPHNPGENPIRALFEPSRTRKHENEIARQADAMLARLGLAGRENSTGDKVSFGQSKRVAIARAIVAGARVLFLDEPLGGLDSRGIRDVLALLQAITHDHAVTLVIVEHALNYAHLRGLISAEWLLANGRLSDVELMLSVAPCSGDHLQRPAWVRFLASDADEVADEALPRGAQLTRIRRVRRDSTSHDPILDIRNLTVYRGQRAVVGVDDNGQVVGFDLCVSPGEIVIVQAPNGWGKSTLFAAICGFAACNGSIFLAGELVNEIPSWERISKGLRVLPSDASLFPSLQVAEAMRLARVSSFPPSVSSLTARSSESLSGGERQRVALASVVLGNPAAKLLLLDEPFNALDERNLRESASMIFAAAESTDGILLLTPGGSQ